jgi:integrase
VNFEHGEKHYRYSLHKVANKPHGYVMPKAEAEKLRDRLRADIRDGKHAPVPQPAATFTFGDVCDEYVKRHVNAPGRRPSSAAEMARQVRVLRETEVPGPFGSQARLETKAITALTMSDVEAFRDVRRGALAASRQALEEIEALGRAQAEAVEKGEQPPEIPVALEQAARLARQSVKGGEVGINRLLTRLQHICSFAVERDLSKTTPFKRNGVLVAALKQNRSAERGRTRRLEGDEEARLLAHAGPHLRALIVALIESGCRIGELLSLTWGQVDLGATGLVYLPAEKTKTARDRYVPITQRLKAVLEMRQAGQLALLNVDRPEPPVEDVPATYYVFGNEVGEAVKSIKTAWKLTCRRAGIVGLHVHDLRREAGSRLLETPGVPLTAVRDWLGHTSVEQTNTYLSMTVAKLQEARARVDRARRQAETKAKKHAEAKARQQAGKSCTPVAQKQKWADHRAGERPVS